MSDKIILHNVNCNISNKIRNISKSITSFDKINIYPYEDTNSPGTGFIDFEPDKPEIIIKLNEKHEKYTEQILSHELLHFKLANDRNFVFGFNENQNKIASTLLSAFEHPSIIKVQKELGINILDFLEKDFKYNLLNLHKKANHNTITTEDIILWADRCCWGVFPSKIKIAKSLLKSMTTENYNFLNIIISEINSYKANEDHTNITNNLENIFQLFNPKIKYEIKYINSQSGSRGCLAPSPHTT